MNIISKINNTRKTLKQILASEWDVSSVPDLSDDEVNKMFSVPAAGLHSLGSTTGCNFTLKHSMLPSHQLHIIYMNFPEIGKNLLKLLSLHVIKYIIFTKIVKFKKQIIYLSLLMKIYLNHLKKTFKI